MFSKVYNNLCSVCVYLKSVCLGDMPARFSGHYLTGNQQVLIFSTVSQPELHPVRGSHGTGRKACVCASALIQQFTQSVIWLALCALSHHIQSCPGIAWQQLLHP